MESSMVPRTIGSPPSWFIICMGTGMVQQVLVNFPYPINGGPRWMRDIAYCFWILEITLWISFIAVLVIRFTARPKLIKKTILDFPNSSYLGAIPISTNIIVLGIISFYDYRDSARWAAFVLWLCAVAMSVLVGFGLLTIQMMKHGPHDVDEIVGVWLLTSIPLVVNSSAGSNMLPYLERLSPKISIMVLVISFLSWSLGLCLIHLILACYFGRLILRKLPSSQVIPAGFLPTAPLGQAAYAVLKMSIYLSNYIRKYKFGPTQSLSPPLAQSTLDATGEVIHWMGILLCLFLLAHATFWAVQATAAILFRRPKGFSIAMWALVFPLASYANAWSILSRDLRNNGMRGWAATNTVLVVVIWLLCAAFTVHGGLWKGELFFAPGLKELIIGTRDDGGKEDAKHSKTGRWNGMRRTPRPVADDEETGSPTSSTREAKG